MKNSKGFTLVELLAVIAILAILVLLVIPNVIKIYNSAKKELFITEIKTVFSTVEKQYISDSIHGSTGSKIYCKSSTDSLNALDLKGNNIYYFVNTDSTGKIINISVWNDKYKISKSSSPTINNISTDDITTPDTTMNCTEIVTTEYATNSNCFKVNTTGEAILDYYDTENNVVGASSCSRDVIIPKKINNINILVIGGDAFEDKQLTSVIIPSSVEEIGYWAFEDNQLKTITLNEGIKTIGHYAFCNNILDSLTIPSSVVSIGRHAFRNNYLQTVIFKGNRTDITIGNCAFYGDNHSYSVNNIRYCGVE